MSIPDDDLHEVVARWVLGRILPEDLPALATAALLRGAESTSLEALAGATKASTASELHDLFRDALREIGIAVPTHVEAAAFLVKRCAALVVSNALSPRNAADLITRLCNDVEADVQDWRAVADELGAGELVAAKDEYDEIWRDDDPHAEELDESVRRACRAIVSATTE